MVRVFRLIVFFAVVTSVFAGGTLDALVNAAEGFSLAIQQQIAAVQSITTPTELAEKTILYAAAKTAYYQALRAAAPELMDIATGKEPRPPQVDQFAQAFSVAGEKQEKVADEATAALLSKLPRIRAAGHDVLQLQVDEFCKDICVGVEQWERKKLSKDPEIQKRASKMLVILPPHMFLRPIQPK